MTIQVDLVLAGWLALTFVLGTLSGFVIGALSTRWYWRNYFLKLSGLK